MVSDETEALFVAGGTLVRVRCDDLGRLFARPADAEPGCDDEWDVTTEQLEEVYQPAGGCANRLADIAQTRRDEHTRRMTEGPP